MESRASQFMKKINFSEVSNLLNAIQTAKARPVKLDLLRKFVNKFQERHNNEDFSFYPLLRLLLPKIDRERDSYGIQVATMGQLYIRAFGFSANSREAQSLTTPKGFNSLTRDYADVIFNVVRNRCQRECTLSVFELNELLDSIADPKTKRSDVDTIFLKIITSTRALDQKWIVRIILKKLNLGFAERSILNIYHPKAYALYERMTYLSRVCETVESGKIEEIVDEAETVALFQPLRSMLCEKAQLNRLPHLLRDHTLYVELKMDGERFQIHKQGDDYRYFSRNDEFTEKFGAKATGKTFSASIDRKLDPSIKSVILDGEMLVWDQEEKRFLAKGDNCDARNLKQNFNLLQVFCCFDILFLNGESLIKKPYVERARLLDRLITVDEHVVIICERKRVDSVEEVLAFFNRAIDNNEEGIILKGQDSVYMPGVRNSSGWFKLKPDYVEGLISDLDLLIIGATRNRKGFVESFVLGVGIKETDEELGDPDENMTFHAVSMVRSGVTWNQWRDLNATLAKHWIRTMDFPKYLEFGNCTPHCWIEPKNSVVLQVKASELNRTTSFRTEYTLRFPRITAIRTDKPWFDCCQLTEFEKLIGSTTSGRVQKIAKRHAQLADVSITRRGAKSRRMVIELEPVVHEELAILDEVCKEKEFCVLSTKKGQPCIRDLEKIVKKHNGIVVKNPGPTTFLCVAGDLIATVRSYARTQLYDIVNVEWLVRGLGGDGVLEELPPLKPFNMVATKKETKERFQLQFDSYNDSFIQEIRDNEELKMIFSSMEVRCYEKLLEREVIAFEEEHLSEWVGEKVNLFSSIWAVFSGEDLDVEKMVFRSRRGIIVRDVSEASHIFVRGNTKPEDVPSKLPENVKLINCQFIVECVKEGMLVNENEFVV